MDFSNDTEALVITAVVQEGAGGLRKLYTHSISHDDFVVYGEEFLWIEERIASRREISPHIFRRKFPDFDWMPPTDRLQDLAVALKEERAFTEMNNILRLLGENLAPDNAVELAQQARDELGNVTRTYLPQADIFLSGDVSEQLEAMRQGRLLAKAGVPPGLPSGFAHIDHHWDGYVPGRMAVVLGRPGESKSYMQAVSYWAQMKAGYRVGLFSPEMNKHEHRCRLHTLASADPQIQKALGLERSFRNRELMRRTGFNLKKYQGLLEYLDGMDGEVVLFTNTHRREKMSVSFIEQKIEDLALDIVYVDPIYKLRSPRRRESPWMEIADLVTEVEDLAERYNIPIVISNQAHRQGGAKDDAPHKDRSFGSDSLAQEGDHVIGVKFFSEENKWLMRMSKNRFGKSDVRFELRFFPNTGLLAELTPIDGSYTNGTDDTYADREMKELIAEATRPKRKETI